MASRTGSLFSRRRFLKYGVGLCLGSGLGSLQAQTIIVKKPHYILENLAPGTQDIRIGILSDFHAGSLFTRSVIKRAIGVLNKQKADIICLLGDYVDGGLHHKTDRLKQSSYIFSELASLQAPLGIFAVLGNHDHWLNSAKVTAELQRHHIHVLHNRNHRLASGLILSGVDDLWAGAHVKKALAGIDRKEPTILLSHNPDINKQLNDTNGVDLVLSGHTHGGQARLPILNWAPWTPCSKRYQGKLGFIRETSTRSTYINGGVGTFLLPLRFFSPPEVTLLTISAG